MIRDQLLLFPELDPFKTKIKNIDYIDLSDIKNIGSPVYNNTVVDYSVLEKGKFILFKSGATSLYLPELGNSFPYIHNTKTGKIYNPKVTGSYGYPKTHIHAHKSKNIDVTIIMHRLVALAFIENDMPDKKWQVDHINENPLDYRVKNLRWLTPSQNNQKRLKDGEKKLTSKTLAEIRVKVSKK